ncbi:MAG: hypothetical protein ACTSP4_10295 [Candidatus Hodarchaeales archaeon]
MAMEAISSSRIIKLFLNFLILLSILAMVGGILTGVLFIIHSGDYERGIEGYKVFERSGNNVSINEVFSLDGNHSYEIHFKISASDHNPIISANLSAYLNGELYFERALYDEELDDSEFNDDSITLGVTATDSTVISCAPINNSDFTLIVENIRADTWRIQMYEDLPAHLTIKNYLAISSALVLIALLLFFGGLLGFFIFISIKEKITGPAKMRMIEAEQQIREEMKGDYPVKMSFLKAHRNIIFPITILIGLIPFVYGLFRYQYFDGQIFLLAGFLTILAGLIGIFHYRDRRSVITPVNGVEKEVQGMRSLISAYWKILLLMALFVTGIILAIFGAATETDTALVKEILLIIGLILIILSSIGLFYSQDNLMDIIELVYVFIDGIRKNESRNTKVRKISYVMIAIAMILGVMIIVFYQTLMSSFFLGMAILVGCIFFLMAGVAFFVITISY